MMTSPTATQSNGSTNLKQKKKGKVYRYQSTKAWTGGMTKGTLKGEIIDNGRHKEPQFNELIRKLILYCGKQGYQYLPEIIRTLTDKPPIYEEFNNPNPNTTQWKIEKLVTILDKNGCVVIVNNVIQKEKKMVLDEAKHMIGMAKWSKSYEAKQEAGQVFVKNKELILDVMFLNLHPMVVQKMKGIKEYKQVEKKKDLIGTLHILKDICFADWNGRLTFQLMTCLGQCNYSLNFK